LLFCNKGDIYVYSQRLKGTEILIGIPIGEGDYMPKRKGVRSVEGGVRLEKFSGARTETRGVNLPPVETIPAGGGHEELRHFLKESLSPSNQVMEAADGRKVWQGRRKIAPGISSAI